ncbi:MAG: hypothetical protein H3C47_12300 [Candidatus Cloacimonetes bacterium]|nr:hypothetical protein [Candidatus Cloacimonadota bacterium]
MFRKALLTLLFVPLFIELGTRLHHYWRTGIFFSLKDGLIFYSEPAIEAFNLASAKPAQNKEQKACEILVSGGSLVYGYGPTKVDMQAKLTEGLGMDVCLEAAPGRTLKTELYILLNREDLPPRVVFLSGFNDILDVGLQEELRLRRMQVLKPGSWIGDSLFLNKVYRAIWQRDICRDLNTDEILSGIINLKTKNPETRFYFMLQPADIKRVSSQECMNQRKSQLEDSLIDIEYISFWDSIPKEYFFDACHLYPDGLDLLISRIASYFGQADQVIR